MANLSTVQINKGDSYIVFKDNVVSAANIVEVEHITVFESVGATTYIGTSKEVKAYIKKNNLVISDDLLSNLG